MRTRDFHLPGRSPVFAGEGMAATSHPLASLAAIETLKTGGTAADAAVAAVAVLCVVEPAMTGIGGDCFCLVAKPDTPVWGYNGSGRAAAAVTTEALQAQGMGRKMPATSPHAVTVPGAIEAWDTILKTHGRFGLDRVLQAAIRHAENGFAIAPRVGSDWAGFADKLKPHAGSTKYYLVNGAAPEIGSVLRLPALAATLKAIAAGGAKAFYEGAIAADIATTVQAKGGLLAAEDLARHTGDVVAPIATNYRGLDVVELPPNGQGLTALVLLNILEQFGCISRSKPRGLPSRCATRTSPTRRSCASRSRACSTRASRRNSARCSIPPGACRCQRRRLRAATRSTSRSSTATAWRCR
jgi:gamma-glutamyltranspeptidase/glutathione hydrolase